MKVLLNRKTPVPGLVVQRANIDIISKNSAMALRKGPTEFLLPNILKDDSPSSTEVFLDRSFLLLSITLYSSYLMHYEFINKIFTMQVVFELCFCASVWVRVSVCLWKYHFTYLFSSVSVHDWFLFRLCSEIFHK